MTGGFVRPFLNFKSIRKIPIDIVLAACGITGLARRGGEIIGPCPIHRSTRKDSFHCNLARNCFHCFGCGAKGDSIDLYAQLMCIDGYQAAAELNRTFLLNSAQPYMPRSILSEPLVRSNVGKQPNALFGTQLSPLQYDHPYLQVRKITPETAAAFGVGYYDRRGIHQGRVVFPIHNAKGQLVGYAGRVLDGTSNAGKFRFFRIRKSLELFNLDNAIRTGSKRVAIVEGFCGCMYLWQCGFQSTVALMGCQMSREQEDAILDHFDDVVLLLDGDAEGQRATKAISKRLMGKCLVGIGHLAQDRQPTDLSPESLKDLQFRRQMQWY